MTISGFPSPLTSAIVGDELRSQPLQWSVHAALDDTVDAPAGVEVVTAVIGATSAPIRKTKKSRVRTGEKPLMERDRCTH